MTTEDPRNADIRYNPDAQEELSIQSVNTNSDPHQSPPPRKMKTRTKFLLTVGGGAISLGMAGYGIYYDSENGSHLQHPIFTRMAKGEMGARIVKTTPPAVGNKDVELCYAMIPELRRVFSEKDGDIVTEQKEWMQHHVLGLYSFPPIFDRPVQSGVHISDRNGKDMYVALTPHDIYQNLESIPDKLAKGLSLVEDRNILDPGKPETFNAAFNIRRTGKAFVEKGKKTIGIPAGTPGGSTGTMQTVKDEITPEGVSNTILDKIDQAVVASIYMYPDGPDTTAERKKFFTKYVNTARFTSHPKTGEVKGFKMGMAVWFGRVDYDEKLKDGIRDEETATMFREWMTLVMAVQMPDVVLRTKTGFKNAQERFEEIFLPLLVKEGVIDREEADLVKAVKMNFSTVGKNPVLPPPIPRDKSVDSLRLDLLKKMRLDSVDGFYVLNRCHLTVDSPLDKDINVAINEELRRFNDVEYAKANGLVGEKKLRPEAVPRVRYALTINEVMPDGRTMTRISTDTYNGALDLTRGKQNTGSYNKKVMHATYLQLAIAALHEKYSGKTDEELKAVKVHPKDALTRWALDYMADPANDRSKDALLRAANKREYKGAPKTYFTGGGVLTPRNFKPREEDGKTFTVEEALWKSNNQAWFKITDDTEENIKWDMLGIDHRIFDDNQTDPGVLALRDKYLKEFADYEGSVFFSRAWVKMLKLEKEMLDSAGAFYDSVNGKTPDELNALRRNEKDKMSKWLADYMVAMKPYKVNAETGAYEFRPMKDQEATDVKKKIVEGAVRQFYPERLASVMAERTSRAPTPLAVLYLSQFPDAEFDRFETFLRKECHKGCDLSDKNLRGLYQLHSPTKQIDIVSDLIAKSDGSAQTAINIHRTFFPQDTYQQTRQALARYKPDIDPFKDFTKEFENAPAPLDREQAKDTLAALTERQPEQLVAILSRVQPNASPAEMMAYVAKFCPDCHKRDGFNTKEQREALYNKYIATSFNPEARFYRFDLNDRGYLVSRGAGSRKINPMGLQAAYYNANFPDMTLNQGLEATKQDRQLIYKWQFKPSNKKTQDKHIGIMLDQHAWKEIEKFWQSMGYPFKLVPSLATVIGISGSNTEFMSTFDAILLNNGMSVNATRITGMHFGAGTPHEFHVKPGQPPSHRILDHEVAKIVLETARGVVENGTGRNLLGAFKTSSGQILVGTGKTGTNGETETLGIQGGFWGGTIDTCMSVAFAAYLEDASPADKFTSAVATQGLKLLAAKLQPLFDRTCGRVPSPTGQLVTGGALLPDGQIATPDYKPTLTFADFRAMKEAERAAALEALYTPKNKKSPFVLNTDIKADFTLTSLLPKYTQTKENPYPLVPDKKPACLIPCIKPE